MLFGKDFDSVRAGGDYAALPAGGYICRIMKARAEVARSSGNPMLVAMFDIIDGEYCNFFSNRYEADKRFSDNPASVKFKGVAYIPAADSDGNTKKGFKGFFTAIEESNDVKLPREDNAFLKAIEGKEIGIIFGREEFEGNDGKTHWATKPKFYRSVQSIEAGEFTVPEDKYLDEGNNFTAGTGYSSVADDIPWR